MARYIVTSGSNFEPFTYDQLVKPLQQMADAQNATQDAYDTIAAETSALRNYISADGADDAMAREMYDNYVTKLNALQDNLWKNGYNAATRRDLSAAREGYFGDITRLSKAIQTRQERSKVYWDTKHNHPDMVMGIDPGTSGLDKYLTNDNYGQDYFSYSGDQFTKEVATSAKARVDELVDEIENRSDIIKDPRLVGYLKLKKKEGFTSEEVRKASEAVWNALQPSGDRASLKALPAGERILADVLMSHLDSTGAKPGVNLSQEEFNRLFNYGKAGLSEAVGGTTEQLVNDLEWKVKQDRITATMKAKAENPTPPANPFGSISTYTRTVTGQNAEKANEQTKRYIPVDLGEVLKSKDGQEVRTQLDAASVLYSEAERLRLFPELGFDFGRDPTKYGALSTDKSYLRGEIKRNGVEYETMYNPTARRKGDDAEKGYVLIKRKGTDEPFRIDLGLTKKYKDAVQKYNETIDYYKEKNPKLYSAGKGLDPDQQYDDNVKLGTPLNTPVTKFREVVMSRPENSIYDRTSVYVAREGIDNGGYVKKLTDMLSSNLAVTNKSAEKLDRKTARLYTNTSKYLHYVNKDGSLSKETIRDPNEAFTFDEKNKINNGADIDVPVNAILNQNMYGIHSPYIIIKTDANKEIAVDLDMFSNDELKGIYDEAYNEMLGIITSPLDDVSKNYLLTKEAELAALKVRRALYNLETQDKPGTTKDL